MTKILILLKNSPKRKIKFSVSFCPVLIVRLVSDYVQSLEALYSNVIFNVVDIYLPENQWYIQWLCVGASPTVAIFSPKGKLEAVVSGIAANAIQCIESSISGDSKCAEYFYYKHFPVENDAMTMLNALLSCKQDLDKGKDIGKAIDECLDQSAHPYAVYLKSLNEAKQGRDKEAVYWGGQFLSMIEKNPLYFRVYSYLLKEVRMIAEPNYNPADDAVLSVVEELCLGDLKLHETRSFVVTVRNTGNSPLFIQDIVLGCTCVKLKDSEKKPYTLQPGQSQDIDFVFNADTQGDIFREITFFSNGVNPAEIVRITVTVR